MSNNIIDKQESKPLKQIDKIRNFMNSDKVQEKFNEVLGENKSSFVTSLMSLVSQNSLLKEADPVSIYTASMTSATLKLPINQNLGLAYIIPYNNNKKVSVRDEKTGKMKTERVKVVEAQFQMGYKGYIQLALRSKQYKTINAVPVYEGDEDSDVMTRLTGMIVPDPKTDKVIGYISYFKLHDGFEKHLMMTKKQLEEHGKKFSKSYNTTSSMWKKDFEGMSVKTVIKLLISKYGPMSVELERAIQADQAVIEENEDGSLDMNYVDNKENIIEAEVVVDDQVIKKRIEEANKCETTEDVDDVIIGNHITNQTILDIMQKRKDELQNQGK